MITASDKWGTKEQLTELLTRLVAFDSITGTEAEIAVANHIVKELRSLSYFQKNVDHLQLHPTEDGRKIVTALVKNDENMKDTVILVSHFDVVSVEDYGVWQQSAFDVETLTKSFYEKKDILPTDVQNDLEQGKWLFGRGTMDMKCGLVAHMAMIEKAISGQIKGNILLLSVCDEEVNSVGMRNAAPILLKLAEKHNLQYKACLNSEPMFTRHPGDQEKYIYTGSIGKVLPGFFCYGKESHVGEPFSGLNANYMASEITSLLELNTEFCEVVEGEATPAPTNLIQKDLKTEYSVQTPHRAVTLFNLFLMERPLSHVVDQLQSLAKNAARKIETKYKNQAANFAKLEKCHSGEIGINVLTYEELLKHAIQTYGLEKVSRIEEDIRETGNGKKDDRDVTIHLVDQMASLCKDLSPMIVLFFSPPFYPAVSSIDNSVINKVVHEVIKHAKYQHGVSLKPQNYFPGMSDLSYTGLPQSVDSLSLLITNMPLWGKEYSLPLKELEELNLPVLNIGPLGKDAHKWTERLEINYSFDVLIDLLQKAISRLLATSQ
ncbi:M20/M25/M40 family metallo-hydrolase [Peribacillus muralis]|uniref:M20/M25/M40 family metallo-hydrolase n=1 Tax=Peribacillus muralis TaxID=264697 RepID=UPI001F4DE5AE|nr:M20/M25/M40 family metallo-hydrolase [Peribacillus muralis]MCK1993224.1 M20/M25/M40 family metallo-hydrolase [Peribacillus muralis]MCK2013778.1 M20/M25/M40 family metallo-hydrolase [Peribacillus muralis]